MIAYYGPACQPPQQNPFTPTQIVPTPSFNILPIQARIG